MEIVECLGVLNNVKVLLDDTGSSEKVPFKTYIKCLNNLLTTIEDVGLQINTSKIKWTFVIMAHLGCEVKK